jgi:hypothetical protein
VATREEKFRQAAWAYAGYGVVYWLGGLILAVAGVGPRPGTPGAVVGLFVAAAALVVLIPWLLHAERPWFDRWILGRRDFARILTLAVGYRAWEVSRIARAPQMEIVSVGGFAIPMRLGAWAFFLVTLAMVVFLARAGWSRAAAPRPAGPGDRVGP